jgi:hypothetical protein
MVRTDPITTASPSRSIWQSLKEPTVLVAFIAGLGTVSTAWVAQHSFVDKRICKIRSDQIFELPLLLHRSYAADIDWISYDAGQTKSLRERYNNVVSAMIESTNKLRNDMKHGRAINDNDLRNIVHSGAAADVDDDYMKGVDAIISKRSEAQDVMQSRISELVALCPS